MTLALMSIELLWRNALAAIPLALAVALVCRCLPCRASTRHALWLIVLLSLLAPPLLPGYDIHSILIPAAETRTANVEPAPAADPTVAPASSHAAQISPPIAMTVEFTPQPQPAIALETAVSLEPASPQIALVRLRESIANEEPAADPEPVAHAPASNLLLADFRDRQVGESQSARDTSQFLAGWSPFSARIEAFNLKSTAESSALFDSSKSNASSGPFIQWREWFASMLALREALVQVTPIPMTLWLGGSVVVIVVLSVRTVRFRRILRDAAPAPRAIERQVARIARQIGLAHPPRTFISHARISPMIWCGWKRVLLLPGSLWTELDSIGQNAVLMHELAHLRRRDHWVRWTELVIGCLYWWHPVVWFIRKKLRDEADFCCDAWVTSLLPGARTSYARALVTTRQYISETYDATPAVGLGIATNRTKRFARRLTMVMTERSAPRLSAFGGAMTLSLAAVAWLAAPLWACPPESKKSAECEVAKTIEKTKAPHEEIAVYRAAQQAHAAAREALDASTYEKHMIERGQQSATAPQIRQTQPSAPRAAGGAPPHIENRLDRLEERLNRLTEQLERMTPTPRGMGGSPQPSAAPKAPKALKGLSILRTTAPPSPPAPPAALAPPSPHSAPSHHAPPGVELDVRGLAEFEAARGRRAFTVAAMAEGQVTTRVYHLPEGKRQALYQLMARDDVPVFVSSENDGIAVQATPRQHEAFRSFVVLIHPESEARHPAPVAARGLAPLRAVEIARAAQARSALQPLRLEELHRSFNQRQGELRQHMRELHRRAEELSRKARELGRQSSALQLEAEKTEDGQAREHLRAQARALEAQAQVLEEQAEAQFDGADEIEDAIAALHDELAAARVDIDDEAIDTALRVASDALDFSFDFDVDLEHDLDTDIDIDLDLDEPTETDEPDAEVE